MKKNIAVFCSLLILASSAVTARAATITLRREASVASAVVYLGDVAEIAGVESQERVEKLRSITICSAPPPADVQTLSAGVLASALRASGADLTGLELAGPPQVVVTREHDLISIEELGRAFSGHVSERTGWMQHSFVAKAPKNLRPIPVPTGERVVTAETAANEDFHGSVLARFRVVVDGEPYRVLVHRFGVERYVEALVAARKIPRGRSVSAADVAITKIEQSLVGEGKLTNVGQAVGLMAARTIQAGMALRAEMLRMPPVVRRGEYKSVVCGGNGFQIMTRGRVLDNGSTNDVVRVRLSSRKIVKAVVLDSKTLKMVRQGE